jgi:hypothetical protein
LGRPQFSNAAASAAFRVHDIGFLYVVEPSPIATPLSLRLRRIVFFSSGRMQRGKRLLYILKEKLCNPRNARFICAKWHAPFIKLFI